MEEFGSFVIFWTSITVFGRGGSDLSAVAIAGALKADFCEIYTDVSGIFTTDPRIEPKAKKLEKISYDEMLELASLGAKVLRNRSVEMAKKLNVNLVTRSSFCDEEGTLITKESKEMEKISTTIFDIGSMLNLNLELVEYNIEENEHRAETIEHFQSLSNIFSKKIQINSLDENH